MLISIIIPTLNEEAYITEVLKHSFKLMGHFEIIVVDGGSIDKTVEIAKSFTHVKVISSDKGRAQQMNLGAKYAKGDVLLFLHADTFLPENAYTSIIDSCKKPETVGGSFRLIMNDNHPVFKFYSWCSQFSLEFFTYGDHGIFIKASTFKTINGYKNINFMEDVEIQHRLRKEGQFKKLKSAVTTSHRRFQKNGILKQLIVDTLLVIAYQLGVPPHVLKRYYKDN